MAAKYARETEAAQASQRADWQRRARLAALPDDERQALREAVARQFPAGVRPPAQLVRLRACDLLDEGWRP